MKACYMETGRRMMRMSEVLNGCIGSGVLYSIDACIRNGRGFPKALCAHGASSDLLFILKIPTHSRYD